MPFRALTPEQFEQEAGAVFRRVFASTNPCDAPFTEQISERAILWRYYKLREPELRVLADVAAGMGDAGFYVTMTERPTAAWHNTKAGGTFSVLAPGHDQPMKPTVDVPSADFVPVEIGPQEWYIPVSDLSAYLDQSPSRLPIDVENALFSPGGRWGLLFSQHGHVVVGGEPPFVKALLDGWPPLQHSEDGQLIEVPARQQVLE